MGLRQAQAMGDQPHVWLSAKDQQSPWQAHHDPQGELPAMEHVSQARMDA